MLNCAKLCSNVQICVEILKTACGNIPNWVNGIIMGYKPINFTSVLCKYCVLFVH